MKNVHPVSHASPYAAYVVFVLLLVNVLGYLDRQILVMLIGPVRADLHLTDGEVGLIHGGAFILTYAVAGLFLGRLVDRSHRRNLLMFCVVLWSVLTGLSGLARSGHELFLARMGVGIGEAALIPAAASLISDYFDPARRGRAMGVLLMGNYVGTGMSYGLIGGLMPVLTGVSATFAGRGLDMAPWRMAMVLVCAVGLVLAMALLTVKEPPRRSMKTQAPAGDARFWLRRWRLYLTHHTAFAFLAFSVFGMHAWTPTAIMREHGWSPTEVGFAYGLLVSVTGCAGTLGGGFLGDRLRRLRGPAGRFAAVPVLMAAAVAGGLLLFRQTSPVSILAGITAVNLCLSAALAIGVTSVADIAPAPQRGMTTAAYLLFSGIIGAGVAPAVIGVLNDDVGSVSIHLSQIVAGVTLFGIIASAALFLLFFRQIRTAANAAALAEID